MIVTPTRDEAIVDQAGRMTNRSADFFEALGNQSIRTGSGTPEGSVTASPTALYMDTTGGAGSVLYIKQSGLGNTGWILV